MWDPVARGEFHQFLAPKPLSTMLAGPLKFPLLDALLSPTGAADELLGIVELFASGTV